MLKCVWLECVGEIGGKREKPRQGMLKVVEGLSPRVWWKGGGITFWAPLGAVATESSQCGFVKAIVVGGRDRC
jgi:hypothetical protein